MAEPEKKPDIEVKDEEAAVEQVIQMDAADTAAAQGEEQPEPPAAADTGDMANELMQNPEVLAALQGHLRSLTGQPADYIQSLPKVVKRRLKALKKLQNEMIKIESKFYEEVHELECKYAAKYAPIMERRRDVVTGSVEPTDSDCDWPTDEEDDDEEEEEGAAKDAVDKLANEVKNKAKIEDKKEENTSEEPEETPDGVPGFWLTIFKNVDMLNEMLQEHDEPILTHLQDIKVKFQENPVGFTLEFYFELNEYFTNSVLTKEYFMRVEPDDTDPFSYEGPEIVKCKGCAIDWKKGKNVTVKVIKKTQKHKGRGTKRTVTKTVQNDSFFNFFDPPKVEEGEEDEDTEALLTGDWEIGHFIRERVVPRAVLYFTGEALEDDEFEEEGEEEENDDADDDDDNDPDFNPQAPGQKPSECKQQ